MKEILIVYFVGACISLGLGINDSNMNGRFNIDSGDILGLMRDFFLSWIMVGYYSRFK